MFKRKNLTKMLVIVLLSGVFSLRAQAEKLLPPAKKIAESIGLTPKELDVAKKYNFYSMFNTTMEENNLQNPKQGSMNQQMIAHGVLSNANKKAAYDKLLRNIKQSERNPLLLMPYKDTQQEKKIVRIANVPEFKTTNDAKNWLIEQLRILGRAIRTQPKLMRSIVTARRTVQLKPYNKATLTEVRKFVLKGQSVKEIQQNAEQKNRLEQVLAFLDKELGIRRPSATRQPIGQTVPKVTPGVKRQVTKPGFVEKPRARKGKLIKPGSYILPVNVKAK